MVSFCKADKDFSDFVNLKRLKILEIPAKVASAQKENNFNSSTSPTFGLFFWSPAQQRATKKVSIAHLISAEIHFELFHVTQKAAAIFCYFYFGSDRGNIKKLLVVREYSTPKNPVFSLRHKEKKKEGIIGSGVFIQILFCFVLSACSWWCFMYSQAVDPASRW